MLLLRQIGSLWRASSTSCHMLPAHLPFVPATVGWMGRRLLSLQTRVDPSLRRVSAAGRFFCVLARFSDTTARAVIRATTPPPLPVLQEEDLEEQFTKGSGNGGQKVNKSVNCVILKHKPTGLVVKCHQERSLALNRSVARKILQTKLDILLNGRDSKSERARVKARKQSARRARRSTQKYHGDGEQEASSSAQDRTVDLRPVSTAAAAAAQQAGTAPLADHLHAQSNVG